MSRRRCRSGARVRGLAVLLAFAAVSATGARSARHRAGPPAGHTGGFGEPTCRECHFDALPNEPPGRVAVRDAPPAYAAGRAYELRIVLQRAGMALGGFQLAVRFAAGDSAGRPAGIVAPSDASTVVAIDTVTGLPYLQHASGAQPASGDAAVWTFRWTAPTAALGPVVVHVAANAANDDDSPLGDFIYTTVATVPAARR